MHLTTSQISIVGQAIQGQGIWPSQNPQGLVRYLTCASRSCTESSPGIKWVWLLRSMQAGTRVQLLVRWRGWQSVARCRKSAMVQIGWGWSEVLSVDIACYPSVMHWPMHARQQSVTSVTLFRSSELWLVCVYTECWSPLISHSRKLAWTCHALQVAGAVNPHSAVFRTHEWSFNNRLFTG